MHPGNTAPKHVEANPLLLLGLEQQNAFRGGISVVGVDLVCFWRRAPQELKARPLIRGLLLPPCGGSCFRLAPDLVYEARWARSRRRPSPLPVDPNAFYCVVISRPPSPASVGKPIVLSSLPRWPAGPLCIPLSALPLSRVASSWSPMVCRRLPWAKIAYP